MDLAAGVFGEKSRLGSFLDHLGVIKDPRDVRRVAHPLSEVLLLVVCGTLADCDDYDHIAEWGESQIAFLRGFLPYHFGVPSGRWLTLVMNRINPVLFSAAFTSWVRATWPDRADFVAIDGKTSRRSHDRAQGQGPLHLVSAFATTSGLVLGQEAVEGKTNELSAIPVLIDRLGENDGLKGALVSIDAIATNAAIATKIVDAGADYLLAVKRNQPTLRAEVEGLFDAAQLSREDRVVEGDKGHGRIERRAVSVAKEVDWLDGERRFPGEFRLPGAATIIRVQSRAELCDRSRMETRYYISSAILTAQKAAEAVRGHWGIENRLHWVLDVTFAEDQSRLRKGHGAKNMAIVRHFAINLIRHAPEPVRLPKPNWPRKTTKPSKPKKTSLKLRRKIAGWRPEYLNATLQISVR
jgi:predicted transposase YbfD/YdcC